MWAAKYGYRMARTTRLLTVHTGEKIDDDGTIMFIATIRSDTSLSQETLKQTIGSSLDISLHAFGIVNLERSRPMYVAMLTVFFMLF